MEYDTSVDYYEVLELEDYTCPYDDIKAAYRRLALRYHPDKQQQHADLNTTLSDINTDKFTIIQRAWEVLSDTENKRRVYDRECTKAQAKGLHAEEMTLLLSLENTESPASSAASDSDFSYDRSNNQWMKSCRCGEVYTITSDDITEEDSVLLLQCMGCSLYIQVNILP